MSCRKQTLVILLSIIFASACHDAPVRITESLISKRGGVFIFLAADCPLSQSYTLTLNRLNAQFEPKGIAFYGVFSGNGSDKKAIDDFISVYKLDFPVLSDSDMSLADFFGATKTPEVFALNADRKVFYKGAIDNGSPDLGQHRTVVTEHYLLDALNSFLEHRTPQVKQTEAVGCFIERL